MQTRIVAMGAALLVAGLIGLSAQGAPREVSLLITGGILVTVDGDRRVIADGAVAIDGSEIVAVETTEAAQRRFRGRETIDAGGQVIMPGLINMHTHAATVLYRGLADDVSLMDWLNKHILPAEAKTVSPAFVRAGMRLAALEMIQSGTTTFADMYYFEEDAAHEARKAGLRAVLGQMIIQFPAPDARTPADALERAETFIQAFMSDPLITPAVAPHALSTLDGPTLRAARQLSLRYRVPTLIHLAETRDEVSTARERFKSSPVAYLDGLGFLGPGVLAAHAVWVTAADIALLKARGVGISHNPESNMKMANGTAPVTLLLREGLALGLGTDGAATNNDLDMFESMRLASLLHKLQTFDPKAVSAWQALEMGTIGGARALGMAGAIGSLEPGKKADVIIVSMRSARQTPMYDPVSHLVYVTRGDDVQTAIVHGEVLMRDRVVQTLDANAVLEEARAWGVKVREAIK